MKARTKKRRARPRGPSVAERICEAISMAGYEQNNTAAALRDLTSQLVVERRRAERLAEIDAAIDLAQRAFRVVCDIRAGRLSGIENRQAGVYDDARTVLDRLTDTLLEERREVARGVRQ